jgi:IS30 family transposase
MEQEKGSIQSRKGKHLDENERIFIEQSLRAKRAIKDIAKELQRDRRTIEREIEKGMVKRVNSDLTTTYCYSADRGQDVHDLNATAKGAKVKLKTNSEALPFIQYHILEKKWSPEVVAAFMKKRKIEGAVCSKTIYTYIDRGEIPGVSNDTLLEKRMRGRKHKSLTRKRKRGVPPGRDISDRPSEINDRKFFGDWEIDLVVGGKGKSKAVLLTLCERKSRYAFIRKLKDASQSSVIRALNGIERELGCHQFKKQFNSITADNGSEFLDYQKLECSVFKSSRRTHIFYAHPYSSWERGSNENLNRIIRRFIPKGSDISKFSRKQIQEIQEWINCYPRKIFNFKTSEEIFIQEQAA